MHKIIIILLFSNENYYVTVTKTFLRLILITNCHINNYYYYACLYAMYDFSVNAQYKPYSFLYGYVESVLLKLLFCP